MQHTARGRRACAVSEMTRASTPLKGDSNMVGHLLGHSGNRFFGKMKRENGDEGWAEAYAVSGSGLGPGEKAGK